MTSDKGPKKTKVDSSIEKLEDRIAPGGIGGLVGDLGVEADSNSGQEHRMCMESGYVTRTDLVFNSEACEKHEQGCNIDFIMNLALASINFD